MRETFKINNKVYFGNLQEAMMDYENRSDFLYKYSFAEWCAEYLNRPGSTGYQWPVEPPVDVIGHTPGEWAVGKGHNHYGVFTKNMLDNGLKESPICVISNIFNLTERDRANAARIVTACNNFDEMKKVLQSFVDYLDSDLSEVEQYLKNNALQVINKI